MVVVAGSNKPGISHLGHIPTGRYGRADWEQPDERSCADHVRTHIWDRASRVIFVIRLDTEVSAGGVRIRFGPFHRRWVVFDFEAIQKAEAITYRPLADYGGWGIRYGRKGKAYNVSGNTGVFLTLKDGKNVLIGSTNQDALYSRIQERLVQA